MRGEVVMVGSPAVAQVSRYKQVYGLSTCLSCPLPECIGTDTARCPLYRLDGHRYCPTCFSQLPDDAPSYQVYCNIICREHAHYARRNGLPEHIPNNRKCTVCGRALKPMASRKRRYCSTTCRLTAYRRRKGIPPKEKGGNYDKANKVKRQ